MKRELEDAAGYIRMSSEKQDASPDRQRSELTKLAAAHGCTISKSGWYEDLGMTGTESRKRADFQKLLKDCEKRKWKTVFYFEPSRLTREHPLDSLAHLNVFLKAGVRLISTTRGLVDCNDIGGLIMSVVDAHGAHDESIKVAARSVSEKRAKYERGERACGSRVFGYDREIIDESGAVARRHHFREPFSKPKTWSHRLVPSSDLEAVKAVREAFRRVLDGDLVGSICADFNERGLKTVHENKFKHDNLMIILANPVYCGTLVGGRKCNGKFRRIDARRFS